MIYLYDNLYDISTIRVEVQKYNLILTSLAPFFNLYRLAKLKNNFQF